MNLKPTHKAVKDYYTALDQYARLRITHEGAVHSAFQSLLESCARQEKWTLVTEHSMSSLIDTRIFVDGALVNEFTLSRGDWEAKVTAKVVESTDSKTLHGFVTDKTGEDATVYTDETRAYKGLQRKHSIGEYVREQAHTNGTESFWSLTKRGFTGTYHKMSKKTPSPLRQ